MLFTGTSLFIRLGHWETIKMKYRKNVMKICNAHKERGTKKNIFKFVFKLVRDKTENKRIQAGALIFP